MELLSTVQVYLRRTGMPPTAFGRAAVNDPRLVNDLANGRQPGTRMCDRVVAFIAAHPERYR